MEVGFKSRKASSASVKKHGSKLVSTLTGTKLFGGKRKGGERKEKGSSKYTVVRDTDTAEAKVWRHGTDVTPLAMTALSGEQPLFGAENHMSWEQLSIEAFIAPTQPVVVDDFGAPTVISKKFTQAPNPFSKKRLELDAAKAKEHTHASAGNGVVVEMSDGRIVSDDESRRQIVGAHVSDEMTETLCKSLFSVRSELKQKKEELSEGIQTCVCTQTVASLQMDRGVSVIPKETAHKRSQTDSFEMYDGIGLRLLKKPRIDAFALMERAVLQNATSDRHRLYREDSQSGGRADLQQLWQLDLWRYSAVSRLRLPVTCVKYNPLSVELLAASYGSRHSDGGCIALWSMKNTAVAERVLECGSGVLSVDWCPTTPYLLAAARSDGHVTVFDVRLPATEGGAEVLAQSSLSEDKSRKHSDCVWEVLWQKTNGSTAMSAQLSDDLCTCKLYSVSSDSIVKQWSLRKGLLQAEVMRLSEDALTCIDGFDAAQPSDYLLGTHSGAVHRCSVSYSEQVLATYSGHSAPVSRCRKSPFDANVFATVSADWSLKLWAANESKCRLELSPANEQLLDVSWAPFDSCVLASVSSSSLQIWDISQSKKDPLVEECIEGATVVAFAPQSPAIVVGDCKGVLSVFRLNAMDTAKGKRTNAEETMRLEAAIATHHLDEPI